MFNDLYNRNFGLDVIRFIAILLVVIVHSNEYINPKFIGYFSIVDGVNLFFVLSGYLIGQIIIKQIIVTNQINFRTIKLFLIRRWLRTLPNYFLFLFINIILIYFNLIDGFLNKYIITFFVFCQNLFKPYDFLFWESWSLSVEEWFYFSFPFLLLIINKFNRSNPKRTLIISILIFIIFPFIVRILNIDSSINYAQFDLFFRKLVITRLDTIGFGILGAFLIHFYNKDVLKYKKVFFILGVSGILFLRFSNFSIVFEETLEFTLSSLFILLLFPYLESIQRIKQILKPVTFISKISFSMYLIHIPLLSILKNVNFQNHGYNYFFVYLLFLFILILFSFLCYKYYESYFLKLREKFQ